MKIENSVMIIGLRSIRDYLRSVKQERAIFDVLLTASEYFPINKYKTDNFKYLRDLNDFFRYGSATENSFRF